MDFLVSLADLDQFAGRFWELVNDAKVFAFHGNMGAGKTTVINALCQYKGVKDVTASPSFSIINEYGYTEEGLENTIYHIDLYRLKDEEEVIQSGVEDCVYSGYTCLVEWPEKAPWLFDQRAVHVFIDPVAESTRKVEVKMPSL